MTEATQRTSDSGVSIWLDDLSRTRIESGNLQELIKDKNVVGVTTNPSIFQKALSQVGPYDAQLKELGKVDTLIFSLERYEQVIDAFIEGIAQADANGHDLKHIGSVASFFVSRVDTAVDNKLEEIGSDEAKALEGKAAIANARLAYELFENKFANDPRWAALEAKGAKKQRPLWASTGTKNPAYSDCVYVDELVAPLIVNTMPEKTLNALADHGNGAPTIKGTYEESHAIMAKLAELGIDFKAVTDKLEADGVASFIKSWDSVLTDVQAGIDRVNG